jgi:hypothetical protein
MRHADPLHGFHRGESRVVLANFIADWQVHLTKVSTIMLLREPQPYPEFKRKFNEFETELELSAMPKESSFSGTLGWQNSLPQIPKPDYPPYWDRTPWWKRLDIEKMIGRGFIIIGFVVLVFLGSIYIYKVIQLSLAATIK